MAQPIHYTPRPPKLGPDAHEELERLLQTCHEHGVLRLANDLVAANTKIAEILVGGLNTEGARRGVQNLAILAMALSRFDPSDFYRLVFALDGAAQCVARFKPGDGDIEAPGVTGAYRMLHDEPMWQALTPLVEALKTFAEGLQRELENPISDFSGKRGAPG